MLNNLGLGFVVTAKDLSKATFEQVQESLGTTGLKIGKISEETKEASEVFSRASFAMGLAGAAILGALGLATEKAHELEEAFKLVSTRADESTLPMEKVRDLTLELSNAYGVDQAQLARGVYDAISKGATDAASQTSVLTAATRLSVGAHIALNESLESTTQVLRAFHLPMSDAAMVTDQLLKASEQGAGSIGELSAALEHVGPGAARAGLSSADLLGTVTALSNAGLKGRAAIGGMRAVIDALIAPTDAAKTQAAALGITLDSSKIAAQGFVPWIQSLAGNTKLTTAAMSKLFGSTEATTAAMALMRNGGNDLSESLNNIKNSTGAAADAAETMTDEWARSKTLTTNALIALGKAFLPLTEAILKPLNAAVEWFTKLSPGIQKAISYGLLFVGATLLIAGGIAGITAGIAAFGATVAPVIAASVALLWPVAAALVGIIAAVALVKAAWDANFGGIRTTLLDFYGKVKLVWDGIVQLFSQGGFSGAVYSEMNKAGNGGIKNFVVNLFLWANRIKGFWNGIVDNVGSALAAFRPVSDAFSDIFRELGQIVGPIFSSLFGGANSPKNNISTFQQFAEAGKAVGEALGFVLKTVATLITIGLTPLRLVLGLLTGGWGGFKKAALDSFEGIVKGMLNMVASAAGIADHLAAIFGKDLGAKAAVENFAKNTAGVDISAAAAPAGPGSPVAVAGTTTIGRDSAAVQEAYAAAARLRGGEKGAGAESDREFVNKMIPILEEIRKNGNQPVQVHLDGEVIAQAVKNNQDAHAGRSFAPKPAPA